MKILPCEMTGPDLMSSDVMPGTQSSVKYDPDWMNKQHFWQLFFWTISLFDPKEHTAQQG